MVRNDVGQLVEPEEGEGGEGDAFAWNALGRDECCDMDYVLHPTLTLVIITSKAEIRSVATNNSLSESASSGKA